MENLSKSQPGGSPAAIKKVDAGARRDGGGTLVLRQEGREDREHQCGGRDKRHGDHLAEHAVVDAVVGGPEMGVVDVLQTLLAFCRLTVDGAVGVSDRQQQNGQEYCQQYPCASPAFCLQSFHGCKSKKNV